MTIHHAVFFTKVFRWPAIVCAAWFFVYSPGLKGQVRQEKSELDYGEKLFKEKLYDLAAIQFNQFVHDFPDSPQAPRMQFLLAECHFMMEQYSNALDDYMRVMIRYPGPPYEDQAQFRIAACQERLGRPGEAAASFYRVYQFYPNSTFAGESLFQAVRIFRETGRIPEAIDLLLLLREVPFSEEGRVNAELALSELYHSGGQEQKALEILSVLEGKTAKTQLARVQLALGNVYGDLGLWEQSLLHYGKAEEADPAGPYGQAGFYHTGNIQDMLGRKTEAFESYRKAASIQAEPEIRADALMQSGLIKLGQMDFQGARPLFEETAATDSRQDKADWARYYLALCLGKGEREKSIALLRSLSDSAKAPTLVKKTLLQLARLYENSGNFESAVRSLGKYLDQDREDPLRHSVLLRRAKLVIEHLNRWEEAFSDIHQIWKEDAKEPVLSESQYLYAEGLEKTGRPGEALSEYEYTGRMAADGKWRAKALKRIESLSLSQAPPFAPELLKLNILLKKADSLQSGPQAKFELGRIALDLKQYHTAMRFFKDALEYGDEYGRADSAAYLLGKCGEALFVLEKDVSFLTGAEAAYQKISPQSLLRQEAEYRIAVVSGQRDAAVRKRVFGQFERLHPESEYRPFALMELAMIDEAEDSIAQSMTKLTTVLREFPQSALREQALSRLASLALSAKNWDQADSLIAQYEKEFPKGPHMLKIRFGKAMLASARRDVPEGLRLLRGLDSFALSDFSDSVHLALGQLLIEEKNYPEAVAVFTEALQEDSVRTWAQEVRLADAFVSLRTTYLEGLASVYRGLRQYQNAKKALIRFHAVSTEAKQKSAALIALADLAQMDHQFENALSLLKQAGAIQSTDSLWARRGELCMQAGDYAQAVESFDKAVLLTRSDEQAGSLSVQTIMALLRQGKIPQADVRFGVFEKTYRKIPAFEEHMARVYLERGMAYFRDKNFQEALKDFETVEKKYKKSALVPDASFETGRTFMVLNRVEEALTLLTDMIGRYPDHPVLNKVYLNLGEHYFRSQQFDNAINAFKLVMQDTTQPALRKTAMQEILNVYDGIRMYDAALATARQYIEDYPDAEDVLQKRIKIATLCMKMSEFSRAISYLKEIKPGADPESEAEIQYYIGKCYYSMGLFQESIHEFLKVEYISKPTRLPWDTTALYEAGQAYVRLDKPLEAKQLFAKIVQKEGAASEWGRFARARMDEIDSLK